jgi:RHS repeat-associated protein
MSKKLISLLVILIGFRCLGQHYPDVLNLNHIVITGKTFITSGATETYNADFFYPAETSNITWIVQNGTIVSQNINPSNGPVYVTITWNTVGTQYNYSNPLGYVIITQGTGGHLQDPYQAAALPVYVYNYLSNGCSIYPLSQTISLGQVPCMISGAQACDNPNLGYTYTYQWQVFDDVSQTWSNISGATGASYQPSAITQDATYHRVTTVKNNRGVTINTYTSSSATVAISRLMAGKLTTNETLVYYGDALPAIFDEMPYGGNCTSNNYTIQWEVSYNGKPWQVIGTSVHCPTGLVVKKENVRIRRSVECSSQKIYTNILEFTYVYNSPNREVNQNYVKESHITTRGIESYADADQLETGKRTVTAIYFDGTGRTIQQVAKEAGTPTTSAPTIWQDIVTPIQYDEFSRQPKTYLPYATSSNIGVYKSDPFSPQSQYYQNNFNETPAYSQRIFENNPINRVTNEKKAGVEWSAGTGITAVNDFNDATESVFIWTIGLNSGDLPVNGGTYNSLTLFRKKFTNEKGNQVIEYTDKSGRAILSKVQSATTPGVDHTGWLCTYNVYDDFGRLRFVISPRAVEFLPTNSWTFNGAQHVADELCFRYEYDEKGRIILKKTPGDGEKLLFYDNRNRVALTQDANQRIGKYSGGTTQWSYIYYDQYDRPVARGILDNSTTNISTLRTQIDGSLTTETNISITTGTSETIATYNPVTQVGLLSGSTAAIQSVIYYDAYTFAGVKGYDNDFDNYVAHDHTDPDIGTIDRSKRVNGLVTGQKLRVVGTSTFLATTIFYDEEAHAIQQHEDNIKQGTDVTTTHFHFDGRMLSTFTKHTASGTSYSGFRMLSKYEFDKLGRTISISKKLDNTLFKQVVACTYDDFGRLKTKRLAPGYTATGKNELESLSYSYNIHSNITGINKDYALKTAGIYNKWNNFFGLHLGYDNRDLDLNNNKYYSKADLDGFVTGMAWSTQGDDMQRKYDFDYDRSGRLENAFFKEKQLITDTWGTLKSDFSVSGYNSKIEYDANGNILAMTQKGVLPGQGIKVIDDLRYTYNYNSSIWTNKLQKVEEGSLNTLTSAENGKLGDFRNGTSGTSADYDYDGNGNMLKDLNKDIKDLSGTEGIKYNYLNKPEEVKVDGKGTIKFVYDALGRKLQKILTVGSSIKTTSYANAFLYEENDLKYINFEEGRIRVIQPVSQSNTYTEYLSISGNVSLPGSKEGVYDYFIRDHLENVRIVITEGVHEGKNICTMEDPSRSSVELPLFGQVQSNGQPDLSKNEVHLSRYAKSSIPNNEWSANHGPNNTTSNDVSRLANLGTAPKVGPNTILKVMAGDVITTRADYFYRTDPNEGCASTSGVLSDVLLNLLGLINNSVSGGIVKGAGSGITNQLSPGVFSNFLNSQPCSGSTSKPRAYLTIMFFDEQFNFIEDGSTFQRVFESGNGSDPDKQPLQLLNIKAPKNGYAYVYVSNESQEYVYFDNLEVKHERGRIVEENHYYPFGLKIASISAHKLEDPAGNEGKVKNEYQYNDKELIDELEINWYDYGLREYDPQIGRFFRIDPLTDDYPYWTPYQYAGDEPIGNMDLDGAEQLPKTFVPLAPGIPLMLDAEMLENIIGFSKAKMLPAFTVLAAKSTKISLTLTQKIQFGLNVSLIATNNEVAAGLITGVVEETISTIDALPWDVNDPTKFAMRFFQLRETVKNIDAFVKMPDVMKGYIIYNNISSQADAFKNGSNFKKGKMLGSFGAAIFGTKGAWVPGRGFEALMEAGEAARYLKYWERNYAPTFAPGVKRMDWNRISFRTGKLETSRVIYDDYGRQIYRVDFTDHMRPDMHSSPHLHYYQYNYEFSTGPKESIFNLKDK